MVTTETTTDQETDMTFNLKNYPWITSPHQLISIEWNYKETSSGSTQCEAWKGQYVIDSFIRAGYTIESIVPFV